jgi:hypothetical protein
MIDEVRYHLLRPGQIRERREACPAVYIPIGTLEWHGVHNPVGADTLQAEGLAILAAEKGGGVVFPPLYYGESRVESLMESGAEDRDRIAAGYGLSPDNFLLDRGVGLVVMHHAIAAFKDWPEYEKIIGAKYYLHPEEKDGVKHPPSTCRHGVAMKIRVEDPDHPITKGLSDFEVKDETYATWTYHDGNHLLLSTDTTGSDRAIAWARSYRNSRVFYIQLGHGTETFADRNYRHVVTRAIRWAAMRLPAGSEPKGPP